MVTYLVPVFAVVFGVTILGEPLSWHEPVGGRADHRSASRSRRACSARANPLPSDRFQERCRSG